MSGKLRDVFGKPFDYGVEGRQGRRQKMAMGVATDYYRTSIEHGKSKKDVELTIGDLLSRHVIPRSLNDRARRMLRDKKFWGDSFIGGPAKYGLHPNGSL